MNEETVNQETAPETEPAEQTAEAPETDQTAGAPETETAGEPVRSFTQAEVDAIIGERLAREKAKYQENLKAAQDRAKDLQQQVDSLNRDISIRNAREKVSAETGVPASLLTGTTEEECKALADAIIKWKGRQPNYPESGDGGAITDFTGGTTRDQFAEWARANLNL